LNSLNTTENWNPSTKKTQVDSALNPNAFWNKHKFFYAYLIIAPRCQSAPTGKEFTAGEKMFILLFETLLEMFQNCHAYNTSYLESVPAFLSNKKQFLVKRFVYFCIFSKKKTFWASVHWSIFSFWSLSSDLSSIGLSSWVSKWCIFISNMQPCVFV